jgi:PadR family transcriptional regulator, regulatory protein PadR
LLLHLRRFKTNLNIKGKVYHYNHNFLDKLINFYYFVGEMENERLLGGFEHLLLLAVLRLGEQAYGVTIRQELLERAATDFAIGAIYTGLSRLERKGFVESWLGEPTAERGGRAKRFYRVTANGVDVVNGTQRAVESMLDGLTFA